MKQFLLLLMFGTVLLACNNDKTRNEPGQESTTNEKIEKPEEKENIREIKPMFSSLDPNVSTHIRDIFDHYIHVKTALVNSNPAEARIDANAILDVLKKFDRSLLPAEQKKAYDKSISNLKAETAAIALMNDLPKQRQHFAALSLSAYELAKSFGAGREVYHDHCPMAFDNKGAMWLSENKAIRNPYFGDEMMECGTVEEVIEK